MSVKLARIDPPSSLPAMIRQRHIIATNAPQFNAWPDHWRPGPPTTLNLILCLSAVPETRGNCYDTGNDQFPKEGSAEEARAIARCKGCPILRECLNLALGETDQYGVWGGTSAATRRAMKAPTAA